MLSNTPTKAKQKPVPNEKEIKDVIELVRKTSSRLFGNQTFNLTHNGARNFSLHIDWSDCDTFLLNTIAEELNLSHDNLVLDIDYDEACQVHQNMESIFKKYNMLQVIDKNILDFCDYLQDKHQFPDKALHLSIEGNFFRLTINPQCEINFIALFRDTFLSRVTKNNACVFYFDEVEMMDNHIQSFINSYRGSLQKNMEIKLLSEMGELINLLKRPDDWFTAITSKVTTYVGNGCSASSLNLELEKFKKNNDFTSPSLELLKDLLEKRLEHIKPLMNKETSYKDELACIEKLMETIHSLKELLPPVENNLENEFQLMSI